MPRGRFYADRFGETRDAQATDAGLPVVNATASSAVLTSKTVAAYVNQRVAALGHLLFVRYDITALPVRIKDDTGNGGYGTVKIADLPTGYFQLMSAKANLSRIVANNTATAGTGITTIFDGDYSFGTTALGAAYGALTTTLGNIIPTTPTATAVAGVSSGGIGRLVLGGTSPANILDNSGGTAAATITSIVTGATIVAATQNAFATLTKELNALITTQGADRRLYIDGSSSAVDVILNMLVDDGTQDAGADNAVAGDLMVTGYLEMLYLFV